MNFASVIRIQCLCGLIIAGAMLLPLLASLAFQEYPQAIAFGITALFLALISGSLLLLVSKPRRRATPADGLAAALFGWVIVSIVTAPPFVIGVANASILAALHEAVSCLTTTGHSVIEIGSGGWPVSLLVWRGILHIIGSIATLTIAASVFAAINLGGPGIHRTELFTIPEGSFFDAVPRVLSAASVFTLVLISAFVILLVLVGVPGGQALSDAVSAITTGLVDPKNTPEEVSVLRNALVSAALILGTLGLFFALQLRRLRIAESLYDPEVFAFLIAIAAFSIIAIVAGLDLWEATAWSLSALSTSGIQLTSDSVETLLPIPLLIIPALIGGSALSAAGGIKLGRLVILVRRAAQEFGSLGFRGSLIKFMYRGRGLEESSVIGVWVYLIGYVSAIVGFLFVLSFAGLSFDDAMLTAVGAITNSGALVHGDLVSDQLHLSMIVAMLLGRWEVLALLPVFVPAFWRK